MTKRDILIADLLALPNSLDRLSYISPLEDKFDGFVIETVPGTIERGLLAIANTKRTTTITITMIATIVIQYATATINTTTRIGNIATRTVYTL